MTDIKLIEGEDFYYNDEGKMVLTRKYLLNRGYCCQSGCHNCPYGFLDKTEIDPNEPSEFRDNWSDTKSDQQRGEEYLAKYGDLFEED